MEKVLILQRIVPHYRKVFFQQLAESLQGKNIELTLLYGQAAPDQSPVSEQIDACWARRIKNSYIKIGNARLVWQAVNPFTLRHYRLVVVEQANGLLFNFVALLLRPLLGFKIAFWGHGYNRQKKHHQQRSENLKAKMLAWPDGWFAYTTVTADYLIEQGVQRSRICVVNNSIDTTALVNDLQAITPERLQQYREHYKLAGDRIALYCGSLNKDKKLDLLLAAALKVRAQVPDFELVIVGAGPEQAMVKEVAEQHPWIHYVGPLFGQEKAAFYRLAKLQLIPGAVGLAVLDSLAAGLPLITMDNGEHGPEIEYLENQVNGYITSTSLDDYSNRIVELLENPAHIAQLADNCIRHSKNYSIETMVKKFSSGIQQYLAHP